MAKRRKLEAPSAEDLNALDVEFRSETRARPNPATAPIAQIAADAAQVSRVDDAQTRLDRLDAERMRKAMDDGLLIVEIPTDQVRSDQMVRDRSYLDADEMTELQISIRESGLRLPIEVYKDGDGYALLSGYRRLTAVNNLAELNPGEYTKIKALIRPATDTAGSFAAMIEENEIRANLSHYERGRIAAISAQQGAFGSTEEAVNKLFGAASKSKRSKVRSFAEIFDMLGDMLEFPESLSERRGLRLASALRQGGQRQLREALSGGQGGSADAEWTALEPMIQEIEEGPQKVAKRGRPKKDSFRASDDRDTIQLSSGVTLRKRSDSHGYYIHISGRPVNGELVDSAMQELARLLEKPK